jgi:hypothetical protein
MLTLDFHNERKELIDNTSVIIWDEVPLNEFNIFLTVYKHFNEFINKVIIILICDWKQCIIICKSKIWYLFAVYKLRREFYTNKNNNNIIIKNNAFLYLYKYLFKDNKKVKIQFNNTDHLHPLDEINQYIRGRIISTMDTMWKQAF